MQRQTESIARQEHCKKAQITGTALKLFVGLPEEARTAWRQIEALGTSEEIECIAQDIARTLLNAQYAITFSFKSPHSFAFVNCKAFAGFERPESSSR